MEKNEKLVQDMMDDVKALKLGAEETKKMEVKINDLAAQLKDANKDELKKLDDALNLVNAEVKELKDAKNDSKVITLKSEIDDLISSKEFKASFESGEFKGLEGKSFELKVDTSDFVADVSRSLVKPGATYTRDQLLTVTPLFNTVPMSKDKSRMVWIEGSYTSNVNYVGEGVAVASDDTGSEDEKYREIAKVAAKMKFTTENFEDTSAFASRMQNKLQFNSKKFVNTELISGNGDDTTNKKHIYGLKTQGSTAFSAGSLALAFQDASIDDLAIAINVQADVYTPNFVFMNKLTVAKYTREKDTTGQLIIRMVNGQKVLGGMQIIESYAMGNDEMLAVDSTTLELWVKRNLEFKLGQEASDLSTDKYTAVAFWRGQALVEGPDKAGNIYVADIDTALAAITKA